MSLDNISHLDRPGRDELVPSRYALRVGEIDVLVVSDGVASGCRLQSPFWCACPRSAKSRVSKLQPSPGLLPAYRAVRCCPSSCLSPADCLTFRVLGLP